MGKFSEAAERHAANDTQMIAAVAPPVQEQGLFAKAAAQAMEALPTAQEVGAELGNRAAEAKGFFARAAEEIGTELGRLGVQGRAELAGAMFNGNAYVPYGDGQKGVEQEQERQMER